MVEKAKRYPYFFSFTIPLIYLRLANKKRFFLLAKHTWTQKLIGEWFPRGVIAKLLDCDPEVSKSEFPSSYFVHFPTNTLGKRHESPYPYQLSVLFFYKHQFGIE